MSVGRLSVGAGLTSMGALVPISPASVTVGSGSATVSGNGQISFNGSTSISVDGCFTSTYQNYKIIMNFSSASTQVAMQMRMRAAGTTTSTNIYNGSISQRYSTSNTWTMYAHSNVAFAELGNIEPSAGGHTIVDVCNPQAALNTTIIAMGQGATTTVTSGVVTAYNGYGLSVNTSYDGFNIVANTGATMTGIFRIYGYANGA